MAEYKVTRRFRDKFTGELWLPGDTFVSDEIARVEELMNAGVLSGERPHAAVPSREEYAAMTKAELTQRLETAGVSTPKKATKKDLIDLLMSGGG